MLLPKRFGALEPLGVGLGLKGSIRELDLEGCLTGVLEREDCLVMVSTGQQVRQGEGAW